MTWNYRVVRRRYPQHDGTVEYGFGIREVYYNEDNSISLMSENDMTPFGETASELGDDLEHMTEALALPVLLEEEVEFKEIARDYDDEIQWGPI